MSSADNEFDRRVYETFEKKIRREAKEGAPETDCEEFDHWRVKLEIWEGLQEDLGAEEADMVAFKSNQFERLPAAWARNIQRRIILRLIEKVERLIQ